MNRKIRTVISVLAAACLTCAAVLHTDLAVHAENKDIRVTYKIASNSTTPTISRGSSFEADFYFYGADAKSIDSITVTSPNGSISGLPKDAYKSFLDYNSDNDPAILQNESKVIKLNIPESNMRYIGKSSAILKFKIETGSDTVYLQKTITECQVTSSSSGTGRSDLALQSYNLSRSGVKEGERFTLNLTVKNSGDILNNHVTAVLDGLNSDEITVDGQMDTKTVDSIDAGGTAVISFPMICNPKMVSKNYIVKVHISSDEATASADYNVFVPVTGTKSDKDTASSAIGSSKPQIIIESYDYGGTAVTGGKEFVLTMNIKNTGAAAIENVKMTVSSAESFSSGSDDTGGAFTPAKSSNTFFIPKLAGGAVIKEQIALLPKSDAAPKSYGVGIAFKYEAVLDDKRESLEANETIAIPLTQPDRFEANDPELPGPMFLGQPGQLSINYVNKGKSKIFNLSVKLSGNFTSTESNSYIGNLDSGTGDTFQATLTPEGEGTLKGTAVFSYEDASGKTKNITKEFSCEVTADQGPGEVSSEPSEQPKAQNTPPLWAILTGVGVLILLTVGFLVFRKKRKAKKLRMLEESDDYDDAG
jgi:hypothetical protein